MQTGCEVELPLLRFKRWRKLEKDFKKKDGSFDISKVPDICDNIKFDILHNAHLIDDKKLRLFEMA
jgi:inositol hexakisphosphate/diphosphoinositol-pentakisphosphate kinase